MAEVAISKRQATPATRRLREFLEPFPSSRFLGLDPFAPFSMLHQLSGQMEKILRSNVPEGQAMDWAPAVDIQRCNGSLVVSAELPGLKREEVKVEVTDDALTIEGERKREHKEDHEGYHRYERSYGHFYRSIALPEGAKVEEAKAEMKDGVLKITLPVADTAKKAKQIPIAS